MSRRAASVFASLLALIALFAWWRSSLEAPGVAWDQTSPTADAATTAGAPQRPEPAAPGAASPGTEAPALLRTEVGGTSTDRRLRVRVVDADRQPIEHAEVEAFADTTPGKALTDRDGYARLPGPIRGDARRLFVRAGNRHVQAYWQYLEDLTIVLHWAGPVRGRIVDRVTGASIPGAVVTRPHNACKECAVDVIAAQEAKLDIDHRMPEATITGRITLADGTPVAGRTVWAHEESRPRLFAISGDDGEYLLWLPKVIARVTLGCGGAPSSREVSPGATGCDFVVARRGTLRVRIRHDDGAAADAQIAEITKDGYVSASPLTPAPDTEGFVVLEFDEGPHTLLFVDRGHAPCVQDVNVAGTTSIEVTLLRGVQVTLRLHAGAEPPSAGLEVGVVDEPLANCRSLEFAGLWRLDPRTVQLTREGASVQSLAPGKHRLVSRDRDIELEPITFAVGTTPVTIDVKWRRRAK